MVCDDCAASRVLRNVAADGNPLRVNAGFGQALDDVTLERVRRGDIRALESIYVLYARSCYTLALRILGEPSAAEDVVQDVFVRLIDALSGYRADAPFGAWLKRLVANATIDALRRNQRFTGGSAEDVLANAASTDVGPELGVDAWVLLQRLPPQARAIVVLHELEGYTHRELAERFGQSESYSKSILARALKRLAGETYELQSRDEVG